MHPGKMIGRMIAAAVLAAVIFAGHLYSKDPNPNRPARIEDASDRWTEGGQRQANGFVQAAGTNLYDGNGDILRLRGVNLGNWFVQEFWMNVSSVGDFDTGIYTLVRGREAMDANPQLTEAQAEELTQLYLDSYVQERDFAEIAELGMNAVRIPFTCYNLTEDGYTLREDAFDKLDWAVAMCEKYGIYAILDLHGAVGSQNMDIHSGDDRQLGLFGNEKNMQATCDLWSAIAQHYRGNATVAAYDLLNEPRRAPHRFGGKVTFDGYDRLYHAVREADPDHMIMIECFTFPIHGARRDGYDWDNVCMEYHIYNKTPFSQMFCLQAYKMMHNFMGFDAPVYIGEWNAFEKESEWTDSFAFFDRLGWSFTSWTYKTNDLQVQRIGNECNWGLYEQQIEPVDLSTASYEEIADTYARTVSKEEERTVVYEMWKTYLQK